MTTMFERSEVKDVSVPQGSIRYRELGAGDPIVLLHGLLVNGLLWRKVAPALADEFRVAFPAADE